MALQVQSFRGTAIATVQDPVLIPGFPGCGRGGTVNSRRTKLAEQDAIAEIGGPVG